VSKRTNIVLISVAGSILAFAEPPHMRMTGRLEGLRDDPGLLYVELHNVGDRMLVDRSPVAVDGSFAFNAPGGTYDVRVVTALHDDLIAEEYVQVNPMSGPLVIRMPKEREKPRPVSGVVSVKDLQSQVPKKAWQAFVKAQQYAEASKPGPAIDQLERAISLAPGFRDAHSNLGVQLLKAGHTEDALREFREALRIGPPNATLYTNLGSALVTARRIEEGESAARAALSLDASDPKARYLLGHILAVEGKPKESLENLRAASGQVPAARIVAAQVLLNSEDKSGAAAELRAYLQSGDRGHQSMARDLLRRLHQ